MILLEISGYTWLVTGLGFGLVLVLLFCFIYVMKLLGWLMQSKQKEQPVTIKTETQPAVTASADEMTAVAFALHLYYNSLHDEESPRLTVKNHTTAWHIIQ